MFKRFITDVDRLLRGKFTPEEDLKEGRVVVPIRTLVILGLVLGMVYGLFMGLYAVLRADHASVAQLTVTVVKVPLLFLLTLVVTFPSLYVFSALAHSRLGTIDTLRLLLVAVAINLALLASFGPVTGFFTLSTESYPFMVVLNVAFFAISGAVGLAFLRRALDLVFGSAPEPPVAVAPPPLPEFDGEEEGEEDRPRPPVSPEPVRYRRPPPAPDALPKRIFLTWIVIYGVVGAQMSWILRPFIGTPAQPFELFRERESNFFESFFRTLGRLFS